MNTNTAITRIPRTEAFENRFNTRMKFLFGQDVQIGTTYAGWEDTHGNGRHLPCKAIHYDGKYLYALSAETGTCTLMEGDMADYHGTLMVDRAWNSYNIHSLRKRVADYMREKNIAEYNSEVGHRALWQMKVPGTLIDERVRVYEITKGEEINAQG